MSKQQSEGPFDVNKFLRKTLTNYANSPQPSTEHVPHLQQTYMHNEQANAPLLAHHQHIDGKQKGIIDGKLKVIVDDKYNSYY